MQSFFDPFLSSNFIVDVTTIKSIIAAQPWSLLLSVSNGVVSIKGLTWDGWMTTQAHLKYNYPTNLGPLSKLTQQDAGY